MRQPIGFSRFEIKNFFETETLEPRRGPGSQVSLVVIAMNNCGAFLIQARDALFVELRQRDVDRSGQMGAGKLLGRQNFNEVRPVIDSLSQLIAAYDDLRHWLSSFQISSRTFLSRAEDANNADVRAAQTPCRGRFQTCPYVNPSSLESRSASLNTE
jgi:hypothetical protein